MTKKDAPATRQANIKIPTDEVLRGYTDTELKQVRENAVRKSNNDVVNNIDEILEERELSKMKKPGQHVIAFHFICPKEKNLTSIDGGRFKSGNWVVAESHCEPALRLGAKLALHLKKSEQSYFQGTIVGWETVESPHKKTSKRVSFIIEPTQEPLDWQGSGSGERGYHWG